jgi:hypothetical protein
MPSLNFYPMKVYIENYIGRPLEHEFDLEFKNRTTILKYSNSKQWTEDLPGTQACSILNTGNGYVVKLDGKTIRIDYAQAQQLLVLLMYMNDAKIEICETKIFKSI